MFSYYILCLSLTFGVTKVCSLQVEGLDWVVLRFERHYVVETRRAELLQCGLIDHLTVKLTVELQANSKQDL